MEQPNDQPKPDVTAAPDAATGSSPDPTRSKIFISYRRGDSGASAERLREDLLEHFGQAPEAQDSILFLDLHNLYPGVRFPSALDEALDTSLILLAVIGRSWLTMVGEDGRRRLDDPDDFLRHEIATALRQQILVIPVLVDGATMPSANDLPVDLAELAWRHAIELSLTRWKYDVEHLTRAIDQHLPPTSTLPRERLRKDLVQEAETAIMLLEQYDAYDPALYQERVTAEATYDLFKDDASARALLFVGRAGDGKTVLLAQLCQQALDARAFVGWCRAAEWRAPGDLERLLDVQLPPAADTSLRGRLRELNALVMRSGADHPAVIFIDGVNEANHPPTFVRELTRMLGYLGDLSRIRVVVSCREETFARYLFLARQYWSPARALAGAAGQQSPDSYAIRLGAFTIDQLRKMWAAYAERYKTTPASFDALPTRAQGLAARNPLMLRLVAQAFSAQTVPEGVSSLVVFRAYFNYFVEGDPPRQALPTTAGEQRLLEILVDQLSDLENSTVQRFVPRDDLAVAAHARGIQVVSPDETLTPYDTLIRKGVLQELRTDDPGSPHAVGFVFDRMFEFALAERLRRQRYETRGADLERLVQQGLDYAALWGAARTLVLMEVERRTRQRQQARSRITGGAATWIAELLEEGRSGVRGLATDALVQLGYEDRDRVRSLCQELLATHRTSAGHVAVAVAVQLGLADVLLEGCRLPDRQTRRWAAQGTIYLWQRDAERGVALWQDLGEQARVEVSDTVGSWGAIATSASRVFSSLVQTLSFDEAQEQIERKVPSFVALWHVCFIAFALGLGKPDVFRPLQRALRHILRDNLSGARGRILNWSTKSTCASLYVGALRSVGLYKAFEHELKAFGEDARLKRACGRLIRSWDEEAVWLPLRELRTSLQIAAQGGWLAGYAIQGALMARLRRAPDEAIDLALELAGSSDERVRYQGLTVASALVLSAVALGTRTAECAWFTRLADGLEAGARQIFATRAPALALSTIETVPLELGSVFLARLLTGESLMPLVVELREMAQPTLTNPTRYVAGEVEIVRGLGSLPRAGQAGAAREALDLWSDAPGDDPDSSDVPENDPDDRAVLEALAEVVAEMLAAYPDALDGWLERARNPALEARVREKLLTIDPEQLLFRYGTLMMVSLGCTPEIVRKLMPVMQAVIRPAPSVEQGVRILGDFLFDLEHMPFLGEETEPAP